MLAQESTGEFAATTFLITSRASNGDIGVEIPFHRMIGKHGEQSYFEISSRAFENVERHVYLHKFEGRNGKVVSEIIALIVRLIAYNQQEVEL